MTNNEEKTASGMMAATPTIQTPKELVFDKLDKINGLKTLGGQLICDEKPPEWVFKVMIEVNKVYMPGVKINKATIRTPFVQGALMGHQAAMAKQMTPEKMTIMHKFSADQNVKALLPVEKCEADQKGKTIFETTVPASTLVANESLAGAMNLPPADMAEFMRGFGVGAQGASLESFRAHREFTTAAYLVIAYGWQDVQKLGSVTELRKWLLQRLPEIDVGSEDRIIGLCKRIGLRFRGRGRPRNAE